MSDTIKQQLDWVHSALCSINSAMGIMSHDPKSVASYSAAMLSLAQTQYYLLVCRQYADAGTLAADLTGLGVNWDGGGKA